MLFLGALWSKRVLPWLSVGIEDIVLSTMITVQGITSDENLQPTYAGAIFANKRPVHTQILCRDFTPFLRDQMF